MTTDAPKWSAELEAARLLLSRLGLSAEDLLSLLLEPHPRSLGRPAYR